MRLARAAILGFAVAAAAAHAPAATSNSAPRAGLAFVTYNVSNNHPDPSAIVRDIRALSDDPPIVALQEVRGSALDKYRAALARAYPGTTWRGKYQGYRCEYTEPCYTSSDTGERDDSEIAGVALLSPFPGTFEARVIMARDRWWLGRAAVRGAIAVPGYGEVTVVAAHGPIGGSGSEAQFIAGVKAWALERPAPQFIGADFNVSPTQQEGALYAQLVADGWRDAWQAFSGSTAGGETKRTRIDYWLDHGGGSTAPLHVAQASIGRQGASDHRPFFVRYAAGAEAPARVRRTEDRFDGSTIEPMWTVGQLFSGSTSSAVRVSQDGTLRITLVDGGRASQYNGVRSVSPYPLRGASAAVTLACAPTASATEAYAMFTIGTDERHFYRWYAAAGALHAQKNEGRGKVELGEAVPFDAAHRRLRLTHDAARNEVVFETGDGSGEWQAVYREPWSASIPLDVFVELKGGTSPGQREPGSVCWDDFALGGGR